MEVGTERIRKRLSLMMILEAGQIAPARIPSQLDESGPKFHAKKHPSQEKHNWYGNRHSVRSQENSQKTRFQQHGFPAKPIKHLANIHDGKVEHIGRAPHGNGHPKGAPLGQGRQPDDRKQNAGETNSAEKIIGIKQVKDAGSPSEIYKPQKLRNWQKSALS